MGGGRRGSGEQRLAVAEILRHPVLDNCLCEIHSRRCSVGFLLADGAPARQQRGPPGRAGAVRAGYRHPSPGGPGGSQVHRAAGVARLPAAAGPGLRALAGGGAGGLGTDPQHRQHFPGAPHREHAHRVGPDLPGEGETLPANLVAVAVVVTVGVLGAGGPGAAGGVCDTREPDLRGRAGRPRALQGGQWGRSRGPGSPLSAALHTTAVPRTRRAGAGPRWAWSATSPAAPAARSSSWCSQRSARWSSAMTVI